VHDDSSHNLLADEVTVEQLVQCLRYHTSARFAAELHIPDLDLKQTSVLVLLEVDIDGEMSVDVAHLVLEALGNTDDQVVDEGTDGSEGSDILSGTVVQFDVDDILLGVREVDCQMGQVLGEFACSSVSPSYSHSSLNIARISYLGVLRR